MRETCTVSNKSFGIVIAKVPDERIRLVFNAGETKRDIPVELLRKLANQPGGRELIYHHLQIHEPEVVEYVINGTVAPEYWLKSKDIPAWMQNCSLDEFKDALDYAPDGTKDLIKQYAVNIPLNDFGKRQAIKDQLGFDVTKALELIAEDEPKEEKKPVEVKPAVSGRRAASSIVVPTASTVVVPKTEE